MYLEHYGLTEAPFRITPHTDFFFAGANRGATLDALLYAIIHDEGIVKISGEVGSGKTMLCRALMERLPPSVVIVYLANPSLSRADILYALADELGIELPEHSRSGIVRRALQERLLALYADGKQVVVLIDEAHAMPLDTLEEIRLLSNLESNRHKLLQLVLFGQPELDAALRRSDMRQLRERITHNFYLDPLLRDDITQYLDFRMRAAGYRGPHVFTPEAIKLIAQASQGLTRRVNIIADKALLASFAAESHQVGVDEARTAIKDAKFVSISPPAHRLPAGLVWALGAAAAASIAVFVLVGAWQLLAPAATQSAQPAHATSAPPTSLPSAASSAGKAAVGAKAAKSASPAAMSPPAPPVASAKTEAAPTNPAPHAARPLLGRLLAESRPWLDAMPERHWFIHLYTVDDAHPDQAEKFLAQAIDSGLDGRQLRVYHYPKKARYGIIYGDYLTSKDAFGALSALPAELKRAGPFLRQVTRPKSGSNSETVN